MNKANECTCPSGDGSLVHPCPAHPAVEQAGGDERAAFEVWASALGWKLSPDQNNCGIVVAERYGHPGVQRCWEAWQARAALAQPSPAPELSGTGTTYESLYRIASDQLSKANERYGDLYARYQKRVAELERQEPVAWMHDQPNRVDVIHRDVKDLLQRVPGSSRGIHRPLDVSEHYTIPLYAAPVAQAQQLHDLDKQCRDDVARALGLRPNQERGFAWSYLLASIKSCVKASGEIANQLHALLNEQA
ncbi:hypothetical protein [Pseudomonas aeruginosa]|uniref:hypothetical protein n=1 Tax=Pseudomonas aeruginosa TaxID=287 RepID=UPI00163C53F9|nr:hypothetical protein [Pseudomonas aeruginosa]